MKKFLSVILALVLVLSLSTVAFAAEYPNDEKVVITKVYTLAGKTGISPEETFKFEVGEGTVTEGGVGAEAPVIDDFEIKFEAGAATADGATGTYTIVLPEFPAVGIYTYPITEVNNNVGGVDYNDKIMYLKVTVIQDEESGLIRVAAVRLENPVSGEKIAEVENTYTAGSLKVSKEVVGALGDRNKEFSIKVTLTGKDGKTYAVPCGDGSDTGIAVNSSKTYTLKHGESVTITNIPEGVSYEVEEINVPEDYEETYDGNEKGIIEDAAVNTVVTNTKDGTPDTGISLDSMPYVVLLTVAALGVAVVLTKKRIAE